MLRTEGRVKMQKNTYNTTQVVKPIKEVTISSGRRVLTSNNCNVPVYRGQGHCSGKLVGKIINKPTNIPIRRPRSKPKRPRENKLNSPDWKMNIMKQNEQFAQFQESILKLV